MNQERILTVLRAPHVSEKATVAADENGTFVFHQKPLPAKPPPSQIPP